MNAKERICCKKIGANIREIRKRQKISQMTLSEKSGLSMSQISDIENGKVNMKITSFIAICEALGVSSDYLYSVYKK